ncbi:hypothetical protein [Actinocatenispora comari]|uniref:Uncharacterized protein n=1 Tax=Actinocatenispora comari TaxID=2807577 RepID=A0A8J4ELW0_9ACTN|nr:hypothetical protein [Actinocatenispora comari]GIL28208.1 hypothetical protein NUM_34620 [Actinocatenispora comari]
MSGEGWPRSGKALSLPPELVEIATDPAPMRAVREKAAEIVGDALWDSLAKRWSPRSCQTLAWAANRIDRERTALHQFVGRVLAGIVVPRPVGTAKKFVRAFIESMTAKMPLPIDALLVKYALGLRLTGVALCAARLADVTDCACLRDLFLSKAKELTKNGLAAEAQHWAATVS